MKNDTSTKIDFHRCRSKMLWVLIGSFGLLVLVELFNHIFDLPSVLIGATSSPVRWIELLIEIIAISLVGAVCVLFVKRLSDQQIDSREELARLNRALKAITECNRILIGTTDEKELLTKVCEVIVSIGYRLAWVGYAENDEQKSVFPVAQAGFVAGYLDSLKITWADTELGQGPTGTAIRTKQSSISHSILMDGRFKPWRKDALKRGYASSIAIPLMSGKAVFGALNIYAEEPDSFDAEEVKLLQQLADNLAYGINALRADEKEWPTIGS